MINSITASFLIFIVLFASWIVTEHFNVISYEKLISYGIICLAFFVVPAALLGEISALFSRGYIQPPYGPLLISIPALSSICYGLIKGWRPHFPKINIEKKSLLITTITILSIVILLYSIFISLIHPPSGYDALGYHGPMATFLWNDGNLNSYLDRAPTNWSLAHPGTAELWIGLLLIAGGETLAKLGQIPFVVLGCSAIYAFTRRLGFFQGAAFLAAIFFLFIPIVIVQSGLMLNDLIGSAYLVAAFALICAPREEWNLSRCILLGISLGLVMTIKLALLPGSIFIGVIALYTIWRGQKSKNKHQNLFMFTLLISFALIVIAPWWIRNIIHYGNPIYPVSLPIIGRGLSFSNSIKADLAFVPREVAWLIYPFIEIHDDQSGFGAVFLVFSTIGFLTAVLKDRRKFVILFASLSLIMVISWWFFSEHFPRFLLPCISLSCAFIPYALMTVTHRQRWIGYLLLGAVSFFSVWITFKQSLYPFSVQPISRIEFYNQVWGVDPGVQSLPDTEGLLVQTGYASNLPEYTAYYPLLGNSRKRLVLMVDRESSTDSIMSLMTQYSIKYAYVTANSENRKDIDFLFDANYFVLVNLSKVVKGDPAGPRRNLVRPINQDEEDIAIWRYLFQLR